VPKVELVEGEGLPKDGKLGPEVTGEEVALGELARGTRGGASKVGGAMSERMLVQPGAAAPAREAVGLVGGGLVALE
jgi:hypothetical protein